VRPSVLLAMLYCGAAFGGSFLFMRIAAPDIPAPLVAFGRVAIAATILLAVVLVSGAGRRRATFWAIARDWRGFAVLGVFMTAGPFLLFAFAERSITAGLGAIINATTPLWTVIVVSVWLRQRLTLRRIAAIVVGFAGVGVIVGLEGLHIAPDAGQGVAAAVLAASLYGVGLTFARRHMSGHEPLELAVGQLVAATILLAPVALATLGDARPQPASVAAVVGIAIVSTAIAWPLLFHLNRTVGPLATSTVPFLNPIFGVLWGALFLGEAVSPSLLGGGLLVFVSLALILELRLPARLRAAFAQA
jgi:drug/metabolite transporter (DMT)-like permease